MYDSFFVVMTMAVSCFSTVGGGASAEYTDASDIPVILSSEEEKNFIHYGNIAPSKESSSMDYYRSRRREGYFPADQINSRRWSAVTAPL